MGLSATLAPLLHARGDAQTMRVVVTFVTLLVGCAAGADSPPEVMRVILESPEFKAGGTIPTRMTCDGDNDSPALSWSALPPTAKALAVVMEDPDAPDGTFTHWLIYNMAASSANLPGRILAGPTIAGDLRQGLNDFGKIGYGGPCPPTGRHHYRFTLYALDAPVDVPAGASKEQLRTGMAGHVVGKGELIATYERQKR